MGTVAIAEDLVYADGLEYLYELDASEAEPGGMPHGPEPEAEPEPEPEPGGMPHGPEPGGMPHGPEPGAEPEGMPHG
jgi:hypothetical protein